MLIAHPLRHRFFDSISFVPEAGCWLWVGNMHSKGYGSIEFNGRTINAHRFSWILHFGTIPKNLCVLHKCDTRSCVNPAHLFLGTNKDNSQDMAKKLRFKSVLTKEQVLAIRVDKRSQTNIAASYGISQSTVSNIKRKQHWTHV